MKFKSYLIPSAVKKIATRLRKEGYEAYLVGGAVRDLLLRRVPKDWDLATNAKPAQVEALFQKTIPTGKRYGTVTVCYGTFRVQVTTYRQEAEYEKKRKPTKIRFVSKLDADLSRRDFTCNAIAMDPITQALMDPFNGAQDIKKKRLTTVGRPRDRFSEDALRILRAGRFLSQLGFTPDPTLTREVKISIAGISDLSGERILEELSRILLLEKPQKALEWLFQAGVFLRIHHLFEKISLEKFRTRIRRLTKLPPSFGIRFSLLIPQRASLEEVQALCHRLRMSKALQHEIQSIFRLSNYLLHTDVTSLALVDVLKLSSRMDLLLHSFALANVVERPMNRPRKKQFENLLRQLEALHQKYKKLDLSLLRIDGRDLLQMGVKPPQLIGKILETLWHEVVSGTLRNSRSNLLARTKALYKRL